MRNLKKLIPIFIAVSALQGCASQHIIPDDPYYAPTIPNVPIDPEPEGGSLFNQTQGLSLWNDQRARQIGDILTVVLEENTTSSKSSTTSVSKDASISMPGPSIFGTAPSLKPLLMPSSSTLSLASEIASDRESGGEAAANQQNNLSGRIAVTVSQVLPNGTLVIRGEKWLQLTEGKEFLRIAGLVRPTDIRQDNSISSTKIADARITFSGTGQFADSHKVGWLARFFNSIYWPY